MNRKSFYRIKGLIVKEGHQIIRDPSSILIAFVLPLILLFLYGMGVSLDASKIPIGLVLQETSSDATSFADALKASNYFHVTVSRELESLEQELVNGKLRGIVVIPFYFSKVLKKNIEKAPIQVITDGSDPNTASFVQNYVQGAWANWLIIRGNIMQQGKPLIQVDPRFWYNEKLESRNFLIPGSIVIVMTLIGTLLTALVVAREWERGTMEALMATPVTMGEIICSKIIPYYFLGMCSMFLCFVVATVAYSVPFRGSFFGLIVVSTVFLMAALGLGLLISSIGRNQMVAYQASIVTSFLPAFMLSGFIFEISSMPLPIQLITYIFPARYFVTNLQTLFLVGDIWQLFFPNLFAIGIIATLIYSAVIMRLNKRLD